MPTSNKNTYLVIVTNCINKIYDIFLGTFMVSFLFRKTEESVTDISIYHLACYIFVAILAYVTGNWIKRGKRPKIKQLYKIEFCRMLAEKIPEFANFKQTTSGMSYYVSDEVQEACDFMGVEV